MIVCVPLLYFVVSREVEYGELGSAAPTFAPSIWNCTLTTPTLSAAVAVNDAVPLTVAPLAGPVTVTLGAVVSPVDAGELDKLPLPPQPNSSKAATRKLRLPTELQIFTGITALTVGDRKRRRTATTQTDNKRNRLYRHNPAVAVDFVTFSAGDAALSNRIDTC